jgi:hypothetical protein
MTASPRLARCLISFVLAVAPVPAFAQATPAAAEALFEQGRADMAAARYDQACEKFRQSDALDPALGTKLNLGECEAKRGRLATAWELFRAVEQRLAPDDSRFAVAKKKREAIEASVPKLVLVLAPGAPADTTLTGGGATLSSAAFGVPLPLDPGTHEFVVHAPGHAEAKLTAVLEPGKTARLEVAPGPALSSSPSAVARQSAPAPRPPAEPAPRAPASFGKRTLGFVVGGIGVAGLLTGGVAGALTLAAKNENEDHCDATLRVCDEQGRDAADRGKLWGTVTTVGLAVGVVGTGVGAYLLLSGGRESETAVVATSTGDGARLSVLRRW